MRFTKILLSCVVATLVMSTAAHAEPVACDERCQLVRTLVAWLECQECTERELDRVLAAGEELVPSLAAALHHGPSPASREIVRRELADRHADLVAYAETHPEDGTIVPRQEEMIAAYEESFVARYQVRAAIALGHFETEPAREALERALELPLREDVARLVEQVLNGKIPRAY